MSKLRQVSMGLGAIIAPLVALALSSARQDFLDATAARPVINHGAQVYAGCVACHGPDGGGTVDGTIPRISAQHSRVIIQQLVNYRYGKRQDPRMEHIADKHLLPDAQAMADVAAFILSLEPRAPVGQGPTTNLELGRQIYLGRCSSCHGRTGEGDGLGVVPRVGGQHYLYLLRQFHDTLEGRRPDLAATHSRLLKDLDRDGLQGVADVLSRAQTLTAGTAQGR